MTRDTKAELEKLARGQSVDRAAFLALLSDPAGRQELDRLARVQVVLGAGGEPAVPEGMVMGVSWEELARHAEGTLASEERRQAVERFLNHHFPEALQARAGKGDTVVTSDTVAQPPAKPPAPTGEEPPGA